MPSNKEPLNQTEAARRITKRYKQIEPAELSVLTKFREGPDCIKKGNQKIFWPEDVDAWIERKREEEAGIDHQ